MAQGSAKAAGCRALTRATSSAEKGYGIPPSTFGGICLPTSQPARQHFLFAKSNWDASVALVRSVVLLLVAARATRPG